MLTKEYENDNFLLQKDIHINPLTKSEVVSYQIKAKGDAFHMNLSVLGNKIVASFPDGLTFDGNGKKMWTDAIDKAERFIKEASPYI